MALGVAARHAFEAGDLARAERNLKDARRLARLEEGLARFAPEAEAGKRLDEMSDEDMRDELRRLVGLA